jgi:hypothetical protein
MRIARFQMYIDSVNKPGRFYDNYKPVQSGLSIIPGPKSTGKKKRFPAANTVGNYRIILKRRENLRHLL